MNSNHVSNPSGPSRPLKLFVGAAPDDDIEKRLTAEFGLIDHRSSVIPMDETIHRVFLSFAVLIETSHLDDIQRKMHDAERNSTASVIMGFLDNRHVVIAETRSNSQKIDPGIESFGEEILQFQNGSIEFFPTTPLSYQSRMCADFFLTVRGIFREQLRTMCMLRR